MGWQDEEKIFKIKELWEKVEEPVLNAIEKQLIKIKLYEAKDNLILLPDFIEWQDWSIELDRRILLVRGEEYTLRDVIKKITGKLTFSRFGNKLEPSFDFQLDAETGNLNADLLIIKKIIKDSKITEKNLAVNVFGEELTKRLVTFDEKIEKAKKRILEKAEPMLDSLGFSNEEKAMMTIGALESNNFNTDMTPEAFIGLALRIRGEQMLNKN